MGGTNGPGMTWSPSFEKHGKHLCRLCHNKKCIKGTYSSYSPLNVSRVISDRRRLLSLSVRFICVLKRYHLSSSVVCAIQAINSCVNIVFGSSLVALPRLAQLEVQQLDPLLQLLGVMLLAIPAGADLAVLMAEHLGIKQALESRPASCRRKRARSSHCRVQGSPLLVSHRPRQG